MQHGKSSFTDCFHNGGSNANLCPGLLTGCGPCWCAGCVHSLVESANKRLSESLGITGRKQGSKLDAHLLFTGDAKCPHQFTSLLSSHGAAWHVFPAHPVPVFSHLLQSPIYYCLFPCISFPPTCVLGGFPSPRAGRRRGAVAAACSSCREGCCAQHWANGAEEELQHRRHRPNPSPACGYCRRVSTVAGWGGEESQAAVFTDSRRLCKCCVSVAGHEAWGVLESRASLLLLPCRLSSAFPI